MSLSKERSDHIVAVVLLLIVPVDGPSLGDPSYMFEPFLTSANLPSGTVTVFPSKIPAWKAA